MLLPICNRCLRRIFGQITPRHSFQAVYYSKFRTGFSQNLPRATSTSKILLLRRKKLIATSMVFNSTVSKFEPVISDFWTNLSKIAVENQSPHVPGGLEISGRTKTLLTELAGKLRLVAELEELQRDAAFKEIATADLKDTFEEISSLEEKIVQRLVPPEKGDEMKSVILEVSSAVGGQESMLFSAELYKMYEGYARFRGWSFHETQFQPTEIGGIRSASALISGEECYKFLKFESGIHRVQRVPTTDRGQRIHTSTAAVVVIPEPDDIDIVLKPTDVEISVCRASGPGGQHVNTTESAVRVVHLPTGMSTECQESRDQNTNRTLAMRKLSAMLYRKEFEAQMEVVGSQRKLQIGSRGRSEKIRTYNYQQDRLTDHRTKQNFSRIQELLEGGGHFHSLMLTLQQYNYDERLKELCDRFNHDISKN